MGCSRRSLKRWARWPPFIGFLKRKVLSNGGKTRRRKGRLKKQATSFFAGEKRIALRPGG